MGLHNIFTLFENKKRTAKTKVFAVLHRIVVQSGERWGKVGKGGVKLIHFRDFFDIIAVFFLHGFRKNKSYIRAKA